MSPLISALGGLHPGYDAFAPGMTGGPGPPLPIALPPPAPTPTLTPGQVQMLGGIGAAMAPPARGRGPNAMLQAGAGLTPPPNYRLGNQQIQGGTLAEQYYPGGR
jgi:hypothetical protein